MIGKKNTNYLKFKMFNNQTKVVLLFSEQGLILYHIDYEGDERVSFSNQIFSNKQIINKELFDELIANFIAKVDLPAQNAILTLSDSLVFHKEFILDSLLDINKEKINFLKNLPVKLKDLDCLQIKSEQKIHFLASNKTLYLSVKRVFENFNWYIEAIVPINIFDNIKNESLTKENIVQVLDSKKALELVDFLKAEEFDVGFEDKEVDLKNNPKSSLITLILISILVLLIASITIVVLIKLHFSLSNFISNKSNSNKQTLTIPQASQSASPKLEVAKQDLTIKILNGSGVTGKAAQIKTILENLGYKNIETGNTLFQNQASLISFSGKVSDDIKKEVQLNLQKNYPDIVSQNNNSDSRDILIELYK
ncbi:LytR C-terminal domain-containing protein [Candidatus Daviesbacteria bacterium]|nr:LytR C-terminal domain-containing protein [Candidatus Daviesbacteria bacterium]